jgi:fatty acid desaturase
MNPPATILDPPAPLAVATLAEPGSRCDAAADHELPAAYSRLRDQVRRAGLLDFRPYRYGLKIATTIAAFAAGWGTFVIVGNTWLSAAVAVLLAVLFTQVVFLGHDAGHQEIARSARANRFIGLLVGDALTGLSIGWWIPKHNAHHAHPNEVGSDPDIGAGLIAFSVTPSSGSGAARLRWRDRFRVPLFAFVLLLQGLGLHVTSVQSVLRRRGRLASIELALLIGNAAAYLAIVFWVLAPAKACAFIAIQQCLFGLYLGFTFAPNHKGMPLITEANLPFARRQVVTARNIIGGRFITMAFGGLNYQIEHHLFPTMPRLNLAHAQPFVRDFCAAHDLPYRQVRLTASYRQALGSLQPETGVSDCAV